MQAEMSALERCDGAFCMPLTFFQDVLHYNCKVIAEKRCVTPVLTGCTELFASLLTSLQQYVNPNSTLRVLAAV